MNNYSKIERIRQAIARADAVIIGAGAGLSTAAGYVYSGNRFHRYFHDFEENYGFHDMYSGGFYPYDTAEEHWAYWSRYIYINRYLPPPKPTYANLLRLVRDKNYFVITTNVDHCFQRAGFDKNRLFYTQGDYGLFQCSVPCHNGTYDNEELILRMYNEQRDMRVPTELLPRCPKCGKLMTMNLRSDDTFVEDEGWHKALDRYERFVRQYKSGKVVYCEIGVGYNTPGIIKYPFWQLAAQNPLATYVCINNGQIDAPSQIVSQTVALSADADEVIALLLTE